MRLKPPVAREAGVATPSVYPHFADAQTLMSEIVRECWRQLEASMLAAALSSSDSRPFVRLKAQKMSAYVHYAMERPSRIRPRTHAGSSSPRVQAFASDTPDRLFAAQA